VLPEPNLPNRMGETHCLNSPAWSLFNEYIGNIVYGVVLHRLSARALAGLCVIAAVGLVAAVRPFSSIAQGWDLDYWWMGPVRLAYPFMAGMLVHRLRLSIRLPLAYVWLSVALIAIFTAPPMGPDNSVVEALCVIFVFPLVLILGAGQARIEGVIGRLCRFTGRLSYPLYMVHYPAVYIFAHWLWARHPSAPAVWIAGIGLYAGAIATAWLLMTFYDEPLRAWLTRRLEGQQPPPASQRALG